MFAELTFLGAAGTVTGSRFLVKTGGKNFLVDCGLFQGLKKNRLRNWEPFPFPVSDIEMVFLTHAHIDHSGYLPRLARQGFNGRIYCTHATRALCEIMLRDSGHLQQEDAKWANKKKFSRHSPAMPLYTVEDAEKVLSMFHGVNYGEDLFFDPDLRIKFKDAGHILGSSFIDIKAGNNNKAKKILFSGDIGSPMRPILNDPAQVYEADYLVIESTYGDRLHTSDHKQRDVELARVINESIERGGVLVIPSFAVERSQELLFYIRELEEKKLIPGLPIYLDSPMAIEATSVFEKWQHEYDFQAKLLILEGKNILRPGKLHFMKSVEESKSLHNVQGPAIIMSASGMLQGGRILHHLEQRLSDPRNTILFVGYQAEGTRGRAILEGRKDVKIHGQQIPVNAKIENISGFSGHADYREILAWLMGFNRPPIKTFIVHGEPEASRSLAEKIKNLLGWDTVIPEMNEHFELT